MSKHWRCLENSSQQGTRGEPLRICLYSGNNKDFEKLSIRDQSFSFSKKCMFTSMSLKNVTLISMFAMMLLCCLTVKGSFSSTFWRTKDIFHDICSKCEIDFERL